MPSSRSLARYDENELILCRLCRQAYRRVTGSHLYWKHHLETSDYRERFPGAPFFAAENRRDLSRSIIKVWERLGRHWTKGRVRNSLRELHKQGRPLHASAVQSRQSDLYAGAVRLYGSWDRALSDAGITPDSVRRRKVWGQAELLSAIRGAARSGLIRAGSYFKQRHTGLVQAAALRWGSWRSALAAAGVPPLRPPPTRWTKREVVRQINDRATHGRSLLAAELHSHAPALRYAAEKLFERPWRDLVRVLGYSYLGRERWSKAKITQDLQRLKMSGHKLNCQSVRRHNLGLAQAAVRHFKTWPAALRAAGIDPAATKLRHWSQPELRRLFRKLHRAGQLSRRHLRAVRRPGYCQPVSTVLQFWDSLGDAIRTLL